MELYILSPTLELKGIVDQFVSFQGSRSLWDIGTFDLRTSVHDSGAPYLVSGNIIQIDKKRSWIIDTVELIEDSRLSLIVQGRQFKGLMDKRLVIPGKVNDQRYYGWDRCPAESATDAPAEDIMQYYALKHAVSPTDAKRILAPDGIHAAVEPSLGRGLKTRWSARFEKLSNVLSDIGEYAKCGWDYLPDGKRYVFGHIPQIDQTVGSERPVIFSIEYDNIASLRHKDSTDGLSSVAYLGGAGTDEDRLITAIADSRSLPGRLERAETWFDCGSLSNINDLIYEGRYRLSKQERKESFTGRIIAGSTFQYLKDWDIGSVVTVRSLALGKEQNLQVTSVRESWSASGYSIDPVFGKQVPTFLNEINKMEAVR